MEKFELYPEGTLMGHRIKTEDILGYDCFLALTTFSNDTWVLFDEMTGTEIAWTEEKDIEAAKIKTLNWVNRPKEQKHVCLIHDFLIEKKQVIKKFLKDMKMKLIFDKGSIHFDKVEYLENFVKEFDLCKHFDAILNHKIYDQHFAQNNICYVYCQGLIIPIENETLLRNETFNLEEVPYYDVFDYAIPGQKGNTSKALIVKSKILGKERVIAHYIYDMNTLLLSDISHAKDFEWVKPLMKALKKEFVRDDFVQNNKLEITLGSDPEFELFIDGMNQCGPEINKANQNRLRSKIGTDLCGRQMEIRPDPKSSPEEAVEEIRSILDKISYHEVRCDGTVEALGGHLHFGIKRNVTVGKLEESKAVITLLDKFIGEQVQKYSGKNRGQYGKLGDVRPQPWGFEYRTPPAAIFFTKEMARIVYKIGKNVIQHLIDKGVVIIPYILTEAEYRTVAGLTKEEYKYFMDFEEFYKKNKTKSIIDFWTDTKDNPLILKFFDKWTDTVKESYRTILSKSVCLRPMTICLYGIKEERGENAVAGITGFTNNITHPKDSHCSDGIAIGLGYKYRTTGYAIQDICQEIKRKIGIANEIEGLVNTERLFSEELLNRSKKPNKPYPKGIPEVTWDRTR